MSLVDFSQLPAPPVVETLDYEAILASMIADLRARDPAFTALVESDPGYKILEVCAYREVLIRARINDAAKAVMLAYATGADLDNLAANYGVARKVVTPANPEALPPVDAVMETDADLRRRALLSLDGLSTAGPAGGYKFHALSVVGVRDADASSSAPGVVDVYILSTDEDGEPSTDLLDAVQAALTNEDVRPLTDNVVVAAPEITEYTVEATLITFPGPDATVVLAAARAAVEKYTKENFRIGRSITLSGIYAALHQSGVQRADLAQPAANIVCPAGHAARCIGITITHGGIAS
ncbi:baseplate assembly protein [Opitutaceae bacterium TAV4]|nr:baseplate assembly protein [Opitutaceae bacterium TAV4]RRK00794.1 baseplate assembly protein [Opitutaceae bacterium TAV3]